MIVVTCMYTGTVYYYHVFTSGCYSNIHHLLTDTPRRSWQYTDSWQSVCCFVTVLLASIPFIFSSNVDIWDSSGIYKCYFSYCIVCRITYTIYFKLAYWGNFVWVMIYALILLKVFFCIFNFCNYQLLSIDNMTLPIIVCFCVLKTLRNTTL